METTPSTVSTSSSTSPGIHSHSQHLLGGMHMAFPKFKHEHHSTIIDVNKAADERLTFGARIADGVAATVGSWPFIIIQSIILAAWIILNCLAWINRWDPYPFILLNLALSFQAAYAAPFVMMSQNRQAVKDRLTAENDYKTDVKGEEEICHIMEHLDHQDSLVLQIVQQLQVQSQSISQQEGQILQIVEQLQTQNQLLKLQDTRILEVVQRLETQHQQFRQERQEQLKRLSLLVPEDKREAFSANGTDIDDQDKD